MFVEEGMWHGGGVVCLLLHTCRIVEICWGMMRALRVCWYAKALVVHVRIMACEREGIAHVGRFLLKACRVKLYW